MKLIALGFALLGILILISILFFQPIKEIASQEDLNATEENQKVIVEGKAIQIRQFGQSNLLILDNKIELICNCPQFLNKNVSATGLVDNFNKKRVRVLKISEK